MLTADLVHTRRQKDELRLVRLGARRDRALELAEIAVALAREHVGHTREELEEAWQAIQIDQRDQKLLDGICKLVDDALVFESGIDAEPIALRSDLFHRAAAMRRALGPDERLDRNAVLEAIAAERGVDPAALDRALFGDLKGAQVLRGVEGLAPLALVEGYDMAQAQAVMLRATRVTATLEGIDAAALRALFRKLKFLRLLCSVHAAGEGKWRLEIDGPFSMFESVTKYGLALALALPAITSCGRYEIVADVRWGKERLPLGFVLEGSTERGGEEVPPRLSDDAEALRARLADRKKGAWKVELADAILDLPGVGACVPDLLLTHKRTRKRVFVEVMGYWSRDAVWKRVELVEKGMRQPILFCVGERLRVSEAVLPDDSPAALLVYKGVISVAALEEKLSKLLGIPR